MAKSLKGLHHHVVVIKGRVFVTEPAGGPGEHSHALAIGDDSAETSEAAAQRLVEIRKSAGCDRVAIDHVHTLELLDGTSVETLLPGDVLNEEVRKRLEIDIQALVFWRQRFPRMEDAAKWLDEQTQTWDSHVETADFHTFHVLPRNVFDQASLRTVHVSDGVDAVIGLIEKDRTPPIDEVAPPDVVLPPPAPPAVETPTEQVIFEQLRDAMVAGYALVSEEQAKELGGLREEYAVALKAAHASAAVIVPAAMAAIDQIPGEDIDTDAFLSACERIVGSAGALVVDLAQIEKHAGLVASEDELEAAMPVKWGTPEQVAARLTPPETVAKQAAIGLEWHRQHARGGTEAILEWAEDLAEAKALSPETFARVRKSLTRHCKNRGFDAAGAPTAGEVTWRLLGGDAGVRWVEKAAAKLDVQQAAVAKMVVAQALLFQPQAEELAELFDGTSFEHLALAFKSAALTCAALVAAGPAAEAAAVTQPKSGSSAEEPVAKALVPSDSMSKDELRQSLEQRSKRFGIEIVEGAALTFPKGFPTDLDQYGDPVNLKFPTDTVARARNARVRFKQFATSLYKEEKSRRVVHERIVRAELKSGVRPDFDPEDALDALLPQDLKDELSDTPVEKRAAAGAETEEDVTWTVAVLKSAADAEERTVFGIVLEPDVTDLHGDTYDEDVVRNAAWDFMENFAETGLQHELIVTDRVRIIESYAAPIAMTLPADKGKIKIKRGTWLMRMRIRDDALWAAVQDGTFTGFSFGGRVRAQQLAG